MSCRSGYVKDVIKKINNYLGQLKEGESKCGVLTSFITLLDQSEKTYSLISQLLIDLKSDAVVNVTEGSELETVYYFVYVLLSDWWYNLKVTSKDVANHQNMIFPLPFVEEKEGDEDIIYNLALFVNNSCGYIERTKNGRELEDKNIKFIFDRCNSSDELGNLVGYLFLHCQPLVLQLLTSENDVHAFFMQNIDVLFEEEMLGKGVLSVKNE